MLYAHAFSVSWFGWCKACLDIQSARCIDHLVGVFVGDEDAAEAVKNLTVSPTETARGAEAASAQPSPQKDRGGGDHEEDDEPEEDEEARERELQRIHEELQKEDNR